MALHRKQASPQTEQQPVLTHRRPWAQKIPLWPRRSIRARMQLSHLLAALLPLLVLGAVLLYTTARAERRSVEQVQAALARSGATEIGDNLLGWELDLIALAQELAPSASLGTQARAWIDRHSPDAVDLTLLDLDGNEVAQIGPSVQPATGQRINRSGEPFWSQVRLGWTQRTITQSRRGRRVLQIAVPIRSAVGRITGVIVAQWGTQRLEQHLAGAAWNSGRSVLLVDERGNVLLGRTPTPWVGAATLAPWLASTSSNSILTQGDGQQLTAAKAQAQPSGWFVVVEQPTAVAYAAQRRNSMLLLLTLAVTTGGVVLWGIVMARAMTRPLLQLRDGVQIVGTGHLGNTIAVERQDELGELAHEFNHMSERLARSQQALARQNERLREGLDLARLVQRDLLPAGPPQAGPIVAAAASETATEIGGDFYTYVPLPDGRMRLIIGDAAGKGVAAALVMALTSSLVEIHARQATGPADLLERLNSDLCPRFSTNRMSVSLLVAEWDAHTQQLCVANAGMIAPLLLSDGTCGYLACWGPPLGIVDGMPYKEITVDLEPDQTVVFVSDGVVEARNPQDEMWGFTQLETTVCNAAEHGPQQIVNDVLQALRTYTQDREPADDLTIIAAMLAPSKVVDADGAAPQYQTVYNLARLKTNINVPTDVAPVDFVDARFG